MTLPLHCPEKIIFCVDTSDELDGPPLELSNSTVCSPFNMVKRVVEMFIGNKRLLNTKHEYALLWLKGSAILAQNFTKNPDMIFKTLDNHPETENCASLDIGSIFKEIVGMVSLPTVNNEPSTTIVLTPAYVVRVIIIYGRSDCIPEWNAANDKNFRTLTESPYFFVDVFYTNSPQSENNLCEAIFNMLCSLDHRGTSYVVKALNDATHMFDCMAKLLAHPLQRPPQSLTSHECTHNGQRTEPPKNHSMVVT